MLSKACRGLKSPKSIVVKAIRCGSTASVPEFSEYSSHEELYRFSISQPEQFWGKLGNSRIRWIKQFETTQKCDMSNGIFQWYLGGRLNIAGIVSNSLRLHPKLYVPMLYEIAFQIIVLIDTWRRIHI